MKKLWMVFGIVISVSAAAFLVSCGTTTQDATTTTTTTTLASGVMMLGQMENASAATSTGVKGYAFLPGQIPVNSNYPYLVTTPESYSVGIWRARLLKGVGDATPYLLASWEAVGGTPEHYPLSSAPSQMAINSNYPAAGTYEVMIPTLAYLEQELPASIVSFEGVTRFRVVTSTYGSYQQGDVLVYKNAVWNWIDSTDGSISASRPTSPVSVSWGIGNHFEPTDVTFEALTIPASPSGLYTFTLIFDVAATFAFNDLNDNGIFEPGALYPNGDIATPTMIQVSGEAHWGIGPPALSVTVEVQ